MVDATKKRLPQGVAELRCRLGDLPTQALGAMLPAGIVRKVMNEEVSAYRDRAYSPLTTLGLLIDQVLSPDSACQDAVARCLSERTAAGQRTCSLNSGPTARHGSDCPWN